MKICVELKLLFHTHTKKSEKELQNDVALLLFDDDDVRNNDDSSFSKYFNIKERNSWGVFFLYFRI